jgi:hypothetical protein
MRAGVTPERWDRRDARLQIMRAAHAQLPRSEETGGRERRDLARAAFEPGEPGGMARVGDGGAFRGAT